MRAATLWRAFPVSPQRGRHWGFDDPAHATGTDDQKLIVFRRVRDEIRRVFEAYAAGRSDQARSGRDGFHPVPNDEDGV